MVSESKTQKEGTKFSRKRAIKKSRRGRKNKLVNKLNKLYAKKENCAEEYRKVIVNKSIVEIYLHDKLNINACNLNKALINKYATISKKN